MTAAGPAARDCPDDDVISDFVQRSLPEDERARVEDHLTTCSTCAAVVAELVAVYGNTARVDPAVATTAAWGEPDDGVGLALPRGTTVGRYVVLDEIGRGGMGVVLGAYDPELDRKVALKLLHQSGEGSQGNRRLLREAQAAARLSHPNAITVHDVGTHHGRVFLALEFVDGWTLGGWLAESPRSRADVLSAFVAAGRGLAAAHAAGIVHRDFKPDNVLVGRDGRVRVTDFGLARPGAELAAESPKEPAAAGSARWGLTLTKTGALVGTPAYMAPEQLQGNTADARADQFSFAVALYEALVGRRPFEGKTLAQLSDAVLSGRVRPIPASAGVPRHVKAALVRGLSLLPADRYPSMVAMLGAVAKTPWRRGRRWGAVALVAGGAASAAYALGGAAPPQCTGAREELAGIWDGERRAEVARAFLGTEASYARPVFEQVESTLDAYGDRWVEVHTEACEATRIRGWRSEAIMDRQIMCLRSRRAELSALVDVLAQADTALLGRAAAAAGRLPAVDRCADLEALQSAAPPPTDPQVAAAVAEVGEGLARVRALESAGRYKAALELATPLADEAAQIGYGPLEAEAWLLVGDQHDATGDAEAAEVAMTRAYWRALATGADTSAISAGTALVYVVGVALRRPQQGLTWAEHTRALLTRGGGDDRHQANLLVNLSSVKTGLSDYDGAEADAREAVRLWEDAARPDDARLASAIGNLAVLLAQRGRYDESLPLFERVLAIRQRLGPDHPAVGKAQSQLGTLLIRQGQWQGAQAHLERAVEVLQSAHGLEHPHTITAMTNLGITLANQGHHEQALAIYRQTLALNEKVQGPDDPAVASTLTSIANVLTERDEVEQAIPLQRRAIAITEKALGPTHHRVALALRNLGNSMLRVRRPGEAMELFERDREIVLAAFGPDTVELAWPLTSIGEALMAKGRHAEAIAPIERALELRSAEGVEPRLLGQTRYALAKAWVGAGRDKARARALVAQARDEIVPSGDPMRDQSVRGLDRWVRENLGDSQQ